MERWNMYQSIGQRTWKKGTALRSYTEAKCWIKVCGSRSVGEALDECIGSNDQRCQKTARNQMVENVDIRLEIMRERIWERYVPKLGCNGMVVMVVVVVWVVGSGSRNGCDSNGNRRRIMVVVFVVVVVVLDLWWTEVSYRQKQDTPCKQRYKCRPGNLFSRGVACFA
jgi:hypothetical protein